MRYLVIVALFALQTLRAGAQQPRDYIPNQEVHVTGLHPVDVQSRDASAVIAASVETILHDKDLCCGRNSALEDTVAAADPRSLKDLASKLNGRHLLSDGRPFTLTTQYFPADAINVRVLIQTLHDDHAMLLQWKSHTYVLYGATYDVTTDQYSNLIYAIRTLMLWDLRYAGSRRKATFDRQADGDDTLQGLMTVTTALP